MNSDITINIVATTREEIKQLNVNMARLKPEIRLIIREEIRNTVKEFIRELRRPVEMGYRY